MSPSYGPPCPRRAALVPGLTRPKHPLAAFTCQHSPSAGAHAFQNLGFCYCAKGSRPNRVKPVRTEEDSTRPSFRLRAGRLKRSNPGHRSPAMGPKTVTSAKAPGAPCSCSWAD
ncbi:hypothetical protein Q8A73_023970 [Channa argus]|nr:hypothetical protein Q8A73_023970 [Channa argus]